MTLDAVFRFRAGTHIGGGHAIRCLSLAEELGSLGWNCALECNDEAPDVVGALRRGTVPLTNLDSATPTDLLVIDDYGVDQVLEREQRGRTNRLLVIDDLGDRRHDCEALLDPTPGVTSDRHISNVPASCRMLLGARYALLRSAFRRRRPQALERRGPDRVGRVLVMPGQVDQADLATLALHAVRSALPEAAIDIVLGAGAPHRTRLEREADSGLTVHVDIDAQAMAVLMTTADLAIGAGGGGALERCALALPTVLVVVADNQKFVAAGLEAAGAARLAGCIECLDSNALASLLASLAADPAGLKAMSEGAGALCDGYGTRRFAMAAVSTQSLASGDTVALRKVETDDAEQMFLWQSAPQTRQFARNPEVPAWDDHVVWLDRRLADEDCLFAMVELDGQAVGLVRLDRRAAGSEVSIVVAPERRGQGVGWAALALVRRLAPRDRLTAFVKPENTASLNLFERAGYVPSGDGLLHQLPVAA